MQVVHNHLDELIYVFIGVLLADQPGCELLQGVEERVQVHLAVVALPHDILVDNVIVGLKKAGIREPRDLAQLLELHGRDGVRAFLPCQVLEDALRMRVDVKLVKLSAIVRQDTLQTTHSLDEVRLLRIGAGGRFGAY